MGLITKNMIIKVYELSKEYYLGNITKHDVIIEMASKFGMNSGSTIHYIDAYYHLRQGEKYTRTINKTAVELFLERILREEGIVDLKIALQSLTKSVEYYESLGHGNLPSIRHIINKYSKLII